MKVTIDTKEDSQEDIRKVFHLLKEILNNTKPETFKSTLSESTDSAALMKLFSNENTSSLGLTSQVNPSETIREVPDTPPNFSSFINLTRENKVEYKNSDIKNRKEFFGKVEVF
ncbi:MAG TPA: hypothetical protein VJC39_04990 [Candidatus Nanoarchaeia archaeon]|nr:hypothetical protein [Candidatus Nanoarchaeia archaeon]